MSAARHALAAVDMQRDMFPESDTIRIHGIIEKGVLDRKDIEILTVL